MSIWLGLWIVISVTLLGFLAWSLYVLYMQKMSWKAFCDKHKLRYKKVPMMQSPEIEGEFQGYKIGLFTAEHLNPDMRTLRKLTAVEINMHSTLPIDGGVASGGMVQFIKGLNLKGEVKPEHDKWDKSYIAAGSNRYVLDAYLTPERVAALIKLMRVKNSWGIFIFRNDRMLLRIDTPNPLASSQSLEKVCKLLVDTAKLLEVEPDEYKKLKAEDVRGLAQDSSLVLDDSDVEASSGLELEDDAAAAVDVDAEAVEEMEADLPEQTETIEETLPQKKQPKKGTKKSAKKAPKKKS